MKATELSFRVVLFIYLYKLILPFNPRTYKGGWHNVFRSFILEDKKSVPDVFSSCSFIPRAHFEISLVMVSCYGYEI